MTAPTGPSARPTVPPTHSYAPTQVNGPSPAHAPARHAEPADADQPTGPRTDRFAAAVARTRRTVSLRVAAIIAVVAFLVGLGVSMLVGPIMGGPGGPGGQGGPPGTSTSQTQTGTGQSSTGT